MPDAMKHTVLEFFQESDSEDKNLHQKIRNLFSQKTNFYVFRELLPCDSRRQSTGSTPGTSMGEVTLTSIHHGCIDDITEGIRTDIYF